VQCLQVSIGEAMLWQFLKEASDIVDDVIFKIHIAHGLSLIHWSINKYVRAGAGRQGRFAIWVENYTVSSSALRPCRIGTA
jgi:hypothetical protein